MNHLVSAKIADLDVSVLTAIAALTVYVCLPAVGRQPDCDHANYSIPAGAIGTHSVRSPEVFKGLVLPVVRK